MPPIDGMDGDHWYSLVSSVSAGTCTLMLGPNAVTGTLDGEGLPVHVALATYMKQRLLADPDDPYRARIEALDPEKPSSVAQVVLRRCDPAQVKRWVENFDEVFEADRQVFEDLAALPFGLVVNTSPVPFVYDLFHQVNAGASSFFYDRTGRQPGLLPEPSHDAPVVYQLYGSLENPRSMILSDSDRLDFIVKVARGSPALPLNLTSALKDPDRSFLFLGFDLNDWHLRVLLHILADNTQRNYTSFAAELDASPLDAETRDFYRSSHKLHFFSGDLATFTADLRTRVGDVGDTGDQAPAPLSRAPTADAPVVFICHASEDGEYALQVAEGLRRAGIQPWIDKEDLRGGVRWNDVLDRTIREEVQYVLVLQSKAMKAKDEGYVNREIDAALDRQRDFRFPRVFLIPAIIDAPENRLDIPRLVDLQWVDLSPAAGLSALVRTVRVDLDLQQRASP
jgi:TIR domain/SIR2-like domain